MITNRMPIHIDGKKSEDKVFNDVNTSEPGIDITKKREKKKSKRPSRFSSPYPIFLGPWGLIFKNGNKFYQIYPEGDNKVYDEIDNGEDEEEYEGEYDQQKGPPLEK